MFNNINNIIMTEKNKIIIEENKIIIDDIEYNYMVLEKDNEKFYKATDISKILCIVNISSSIKFYDNKYKCIFNVKTQGGNQDMTFLTFDGLKLLLNKTRSHNAIKLAKVFNIEILNTFSECIETKTISKIITVFKYEKIIKQYKCNNYRIDLYFIDYKLAIECDELQHNHKKVEDNIREEIIKNKLNCTFIRYNPFSKNFNIFDVIHLIFYHIKNYNNRLNDIPMNKLQIKD
jgi:very-short-patch-repair endonuclease